MNADSIKIESDEDGFHLVVETEDATYDFRIHDVAGELLAGAERMIEPWRAEGQAVLASMQADRPGIGFIDEHMPGGGHAYPLYDPKHPDFHENFSALHDNREGK